MTFDFDLQRGGVYCHSLKSDLLNLKQVLDELEVALNLINLNLAFRRICGYILTDLSKT